MNCSKCNNILPEGKLFCPQCGQLNQTQIATTSNIIQERIKISFPLPPLIWYPYALLFGCQILWYLVIQYLGILNLIHKLPFYPTIFIIGFFNLRLRLDSVGGWIPSLWPGIPQIFQLILYVLGTIINISSTVFLYKRHKFSMKFMLLNIVFNFFLALMNLSNLRYHIEETSRIIIISLVFLVGLFISSVFIFLLYKKQNHLDANKSHL